MFSNSFPNIVALQHNVQNYGRARQATDNHIIRHMHITCWITKATDTHSELVTLIAFPQQQCYDVCTLPVLLETNSVILP